LRLDPAETAELPLPAALLDRSRRIVAATPEWQGWTPGVVTYHAGHGYIAVGSSGGADPDRQAVLGRLLDELDQAAGALGGEDAHRARLLAAGLRLVSGAPLDEDGAGTSRDVLEMAAAGIAARVPAPFTVALSEGDPMQVPCPEVIALALVQLTVNVSRHEHADADGARPVEAVSITAAAGPTFHVEWTTEAPRSTPVETGRHVRGRRRWGLGFVRMAADALGGTALPPAPSGPDRARVSFGLGSRNLTLPLALYERGRLVRSSRAWDQEHRAGDEAGRARVEELVGELCRAASGAEGRIVEHELHTARSVPGRGRIWMALPPEAGDDRVADVLRGLDHEHLLLTAVEPHATRLHGLNAALRRSMGDPLVTCYSSDWQARFPRACQGLGIEPVPLENVPVHPDPQLAALLLRDVGGELSVDGEGAVWFDAAGGDTGSALLRLLGADQRGRVRLTDGLGF
jgi:hypothetical protein